MNVFEVLRRDHHHLFELLDRAQATTARARKSRETLVAKTWAAFEVHAAAEEEVVYPVLRELARDPKIAQRTLEAGEEHALVRRLFEDLAEVDPGDPRWLPKLKLLAENIQHHVAEEEGELFPLARKLLDKSGQDEMGRRMEAVEHRIRMQEDHVLVRRRTTRDRVASLWV